MPSYGRGIGFDLDLPNRLKWDFLGWKNLRSGTRKPSRMGHRIFFSVGDPSGDLHASRLIAAWKSIDPTIAFRGFGGPQMEVAGCRIDLRLTDHAVMGFAEVLPKLRDFFRFADQAEAIFAEREVDAVVLVDFPGFNWHSPSGQRRRGFLSTIISHPNCGLGVGGASERCVAQSTACWLVYRWRSTTTARQACRWYR